MYRVLKFGGSSVASATRMSQVLDIVEKEAAQGRVVLVSSAISGCTDALLSGEEAQFQAMEKRHRAIVTRLFTGAERAEVQKRTDALFAALRQAPAAEQVTFGEILSTTLLAAKLAQEGWKTVWMDARELVVRDDEPRTYEKIGKAFAETDAEIYVVPGFICRDGEGRISTLGRGGSDYSAALFAAALQADSLQIWTDVPGIMTANPSRLRPSMISCFQQSERSSGVTWAPPFTFRCSVR